MLLRSSPLHNCVLVLESFVNNDKLCMLSYKLLHEAGQDKVSAWSEFYIFLVGFFSPQEEAKF